MADILSVFFFFQTYFNNTIYIIVNVETVAITHKNCALIRTDSHLNDIKSTETSTHTHIEIMAYFIYVYYNVTHIYIVFFIFGHAQSKSMRIDKVDNILREAVHLDLTNQL